VDGRLLAVRDFDLAYVRFGSGAAITPLDYVRFTPQSGQSSDMLACPLRAKSGHNAAQQISAGLSSIFAVFG
jgi:hypothetical protein